MPEIPNESEVEDEINRLLRSVKKEVKRLMEEAVTRKFIHEESASVKALCLVVEQCLMHGLKRSLIFTSAPTTFSVFCKLSKMCNLSSEIVKQVQEKEASYSVLQKSSTSTSPPQSGNSITFQMPSSAPRHLWIKLALTTKALDKIIESLALHSNRFYDKEAFMCDPVAGPILSALLVGPCSLDYSKMKTPDHLWTDPHAHELVKRHQIHAGNVPHMFDRNVKLLLLSNRGSQEDSISQEHVEALHQNCKTVLLYGKNHIQFQPPEAKEPLLGYLSLHKSSLGKLVLKLTPNQLMNGGASSVERHALTIPLQRVLYIHCHQSDSSSVLVLVGLDGVQWPPVNFVAPGDHLLSFIACLEAGLQPHSRLEPPLWLQRSKGKVWPRILRKTSSSDDDSTPITVESTDFVFRIIHQNEDLPSDCSFESPVPSPDMNNNGQLEILCKKMRRQLKYRAFFGWLSYCRHMRKVRSQLASLVHAVQGQTSSAIDHDGLTEDQWAKLCDNGHSITNPDLFYRLIYFGGVSHTIRKEVWPYLLGHYEIGSSKEERDDKTHATETFYEQVLAEWQLAEQASYKTGSTGAEYDVEDSQLLRSKTSTFENDVFEDEVSDTNDCGETFGKWHELLASVASEQSTESLKSSCLEQTVGTVDKSLTSGGILSARSSITTSAQSVPALDSDVINTFSMNIHRIDKDVTRCDRQYPYFTQRTNLDKLRRVLCSYVWLNLDIGYIQGMCDLAAPLLVIFDNEPITFACFQLLMKHMSRNFPYGGAMDGHFANLRSLLQTLDSDLFDHMQSRGDYTHFYFCYRWFLLDFKRELVYEDVFLVWETIWAARFYCTNHFVLFIALALVETYRDIIVHNNMDFTDIIKFFNEMAERHQINQVLDSARNLVLKILEMLENR